MRAERSHGTGETVLGPFEVATGADEIAAFAAATGAPPGGIPATFPIVWLSAPELKAALRAAAGADFLPVHESQSFDYARSLAVGAAYRLTAVARRESAPDRLVVEAAVTEAAGAPVLTMRAVLRLAPLTLGQGA
ncbi:MAG TPA: hypothetical protein PKA55_14355 [Rhodoblastus sp.]|nr:hypothetical protein [Rhodoblastus sp.]